jgi:hypothetical protein
MTPPTSASRNFLIPYPLPNLISLSQLHKYHVETSRKHKLIAKEGALGAGIGAAIPLHCNGPTNDKSFARKIKFTILTVIQFLLSGRIVTTVFSFLLS